jgi:4'-phosphopantetheinyl transferase
VSQGDYVILAAEPICICGCDLAAPHQLRRGKAQPLADVLAAFADQLTPAEWATVHGAGADEEAVEAQFRKLWSLKEVRLHWRANCMAARAGLFALLLRCLLPLVLTGGACPPPLQAYVKATGEGLGFDLGNAEFQIDGLTAAVAVRGAPQPRWRFHLHRLGRGHWVSVGRAPLEAVVDAWGVSRAAEG